jgi:DNA adenine methylase
MGAANMILRYPGGKSRGPLSNKIVQKVTERYTGGIFGEVFFGGGGITFKLLRAKAVDRVLINDYDRSIAMLWTEVIRNPDRLGRAVRGFKPTVAAFVAAKAKLLAETGTPLDALVVNKLSHGGRGVCAGPQGGFEQHGKYKIDCRWNPNALVTGIAACCDLLRGRAVDNKCHQHDFQQVIEGAAFNYIDPPYWDVGDGLYRCFFTEADHLRLFYALNNKTNWLLSYNNVPEVKNLYCHFPQEIDTISGNGGEKQNSELLIYGS